LSLGGTGPRLITVAEAAQILEVGEHDVRDWIARDLVAYETLPSGERRLRLFDEAHEEAVGYSHSMYVLDLRSDVSDERATAFHEQLAARRREHQRAGPTWTEVNVDGLTEGLAAPLAEVAPDPDSQRVDQGRTLGWWLRHRHRLVGCRRRAAPIALADILGADRRLPAVSGDGVRGIPLQPAG
jgi:hypothetical protein